MKFWRLFRVLWVGFTILLLTLAALGNVQHLSQAQSGPLILTKTLNKITPVVRVGEVLSFTISLANNAGFTLTNVTLVDTYNSGVLGFAGATPPNSLHNPAAGLITWTNVANPPIPPGQTLTFTVFFTAEHPQTAVVNFVRAQDITGAMSAISDTGTSDQVDEAIGGSAPILKFMSPPGAIPQAGSRVTFTHIITNDGAALMTLLPLSDTYDPAFLQFNFAIPTPTITSPPGLLRWDDLTTYFGDLAPFQSVVVTTVFTATAQIVNTINQASTQGAQDEYNNDLTAGEALAPITIIDNQPTPTPYYDDNDDDDDDSDEDSPAAPVPTAPSSSSGAPTPAAAAAVPTVTMSQGSATQTVVSLPETGYPPHYPTHLLVLSLIGVMGLVGLISGWYVWGRKKSSR